MLPASAGMILCWTLVHPPLGRAPRICGDDPYMLDSRALADECSPHLRG